MRVAAVEKTHFDVTNYLSKNNIKSDPESIYYVFPAAVCDKIREKLK